MLSLLVYVVTRWDWDTFSDHLLWSIFLHNNPFFETLREINLNLMCHPSWESQTYTPPLAPGQRMGQRSVFEKIVAKFKKKIPTLKQF